MPLRMFTSNVIWYLILSARAKDFIVREISLPSSRSRLTAQWFMIKVFAGLSEFGIWKRKFLFEKVKEKKILVKSLNGNLFEKL